MSWARTMKKNLIALLTSSLAMSSASAADDVGALLTAKRCNACHEMNAMLLGPPYLAIASRHAAQKDAVLEVLARKIVLGGGGNWGVVPMVPNEHVTLDEARAMARWILDAKPAP